MLSWFPSLADPSQRRRTNSLSRSDFSGSEDEEDEEEYDEDELDVESTAESCPGTPKCTQMPIAQLGKMKHHCTDLACLLLLLVALAGLGLVLTYAHRHGDMRRLFHGLNFQGELCGIDVPEPFLYWCQSGGPGLLDLGHPTCVSSCPVGNTTYSRCFNGTVGSYAYVQDYPSYAFAGRLCMPLDSWLTSQVSQTPLAHDILELSQIARAWQPLLISAGLALLLGYAYLFFLNVAVGQLLWACMTILICIALVGGGYLVSESFHGGMDGKSGTGDAQWDLTVGATSMVLGLIFLLIACCRKRSIDMAIGCIEAACECIFDLPSILLEPLATLALKAVSLGAMLAGFLWLLSCGKVVNHGLYRSLEYTGTEKLLIVYYIFMMIWVNELWCAVSHFAIAYVVQRWYFTPYGRNACAGRSKWGLPAFAIVRGFSVGLCYHLGTLAFGAVMIAFVRVIRMGLAYLEKLSSDTGNCIGACIAKVLFCCLYCFESCLAFISKNAYMDVALHSSSFCEAARRSMAVITNEVTAFGALMGACWTFQLGGLGAITGLGALFTGLMVRHIDIYSNPTSEYYVQDPLLLTIVAAVISFVVALAFMRGFDTVSCTILYCFATEKQQARTFTGKAQQMTVIDARGKPRTSFLLQLASASEDINDNGDELQGGARPRACTPLTLQHLLQEEPKA